MRLRILVFHVITPADFFNRYTASYCEWPNANTATGCTPGWTRLHCGDAHLEGCCYSGILWCSVNSGNPWKGGQKNVQAFRHRALPLRLTEADWFVLVFVVGAEWGSRSSDVSHHYPFSSGSGEIQSPQGHCAHWQWLWQCWHQICCRIRYDDTIRALLWSELNGSWNTAYVFLFYSWVHFKSSM